MGGGNSKCEGNGVIGGLCQDFIKAPMTAGNAAACAPIGVGFAFACDMAGGGPEDIPMDIACGAATTGVGVACEKGVEAVENLTIKSAEEYSEAARKVCADQFCNS